MKLIELTKGYVAQVDDADYEWLSAWKWCAQAGRGRKPYAIRAIPGRKIEFMHKRILGIEPGESAQGDHIDGNTMNNCRDNLRRCTANENKLNVIKREKYKGVAVTSKYKGVSRPPQCTRYLAKICKDGHVEILGWFYREIDAARAYDERSAELHGEFAHPNFPEKST